METFNTEIEIKKIQHVFMFMKNDWKQKSGIQISFRYFEDVINFRGDDVIGNYMASQLTASCFQKIVLFAAVIKTAEITYRLSITGEPGENDGPIVTIDCFLKKLQEEKQGSYGPDISKEIPLQALRGVLWNAYLFFTYDHTRLDIEADLKKTFE